MVIGKWFLCLLSLPGQTIVDTALDKDVLSTGKSSKLGDVRDFSSRTKASLGTH